MWARPILLYSSHTQSLFKQGLSSFLAGAAECTRGMSKVAGRVWEAPPGVASASDSNGATTAGASEPRLVLYNSLVDEKVPFVPAAGLGSKQISWYTCGPTVYDAAHMGHARNYVTFDIVRRVLEDYFGYDCMFVMNVTDVDDKIIMRARRNHLLQAYCTSQASKPTELRTLAQSALDAAAAKQAAKVQDTQTQLDAATAAAQTDKKEALKVTELQTTLKNEQHKLSSITAAISALEALPATANVGDVLGVAGDWVAEHLDKEHGQTVSDASIFRAHGARYEREFMDDMNALGCRPPTVLTRVSEYIPEVVDYIKKIVDNGMAYESNGSVYFDVAQFRGCGHTYGKLKPWAVGSALLAAEGESNFDNREKRSPMDFALWKAWKPGEPFWESPWGKGRPGWHIECSAMASSLLGSRIDIHTGGEDLRFPHHDNELAQAEAHYHHEGCQQWVNYFLHSGHLEIEGLKMSKSLKNFITIKEALQSFTPRQLRLMFALQPWNKPMMYGEQARGEMRARDAQFKNFFQNVEVAIREAGDPNTTSARWEASDLELYKSLKVAQETVHAALCDNIDTMSSLNALSDLVKATNIYLTKQQEAGRPGRQLLLTQVASYVTRILSVFGLVEPAHDRPGMGDAAASGTDSRLAPVLDAFAAFRDEVRSLSKATAAPGDVLAACDRVRDETLVDLGVRLEDRPDGKALWKLDDPAVLRAEQAERARQAAEAAVKKLESALDRKAKEAEKLAGIAALPPVEVALADKYSQWDTASGEPTHDKDGQELDGKAKDKAKKDVEKARKARAPLKEKLDKDPQYLDKLNAEVEELRQKIAAIRTQQNGNA